MNNVNISKYFVEENKITNGTKEITSPSGKYKLVISQFKTKEGCWEVTQGLVFSNNQLISEIQRNYSHFPFAFVEDHPNGNDYLICGEDYQGQTIVELNTGVKKSIIPNSAICGFGFCWSGIVPSPDKTMLAVTGCHWACPYEARIYDFSDPMNMPWLMLYNNSDLDTFIKWNDDNTAEFGGEYDVRKSDLKPEKFLTDDEWNEIERLEKILPFGEIWTTIRECKVKWKKPTMLSIVISHIKNFIEWREEDNIPVSYDLVEYLISAISKLNNEERDSFLNNEFYFKKLQWTMSNCIFYKEKNEQK